MKLKDYSLLAATITGATSVNGQTKFYHDIDPDIQIHIDDYQTILYTELIDLNHDGQMDFRLRLTGTYSYSDFGFLCCNGNWFRRPAGLASCDAHRSAIF